MDIAEQLLNPYVGLYLLFVLLVQIVVGVIRRGKRRYVSRQRKQQGLTGPVLMGHSERLVTRQVEATIESLILVLAIFFPFILVNVPPFKATFEQVSQGLGIAMGTLILWILLSGTEVAKSFLGGLMYKTVVAFSQPFQVGDRVTLKGISGKVVALDIFFVKLQTLNDDLISVPTYTLWSEVLTSANAGERSSLCVMEFYLASFVTAQHRQLAEDTIWDAIQASVYYEPTKPMQIYLSQTEAAIQLTAKAYVALTYNEPLFVSDVTRVFLDIASEHQIPLATGSWKLSPSNSREQVAVLPSQPN